MRSLDNDISYNVPPCVLSHQIFSPYSEIVTVTQSFPTTRLTPRQRFAQLVSNDAAKRQGPLECTYILNLTYAHLLRTAPHTYKYTMLLSSSSLHSCSLSASTRACENTRTHASTDVCKCMCRHIHAIAGTLENKRGRREIMRERERERKEVVNPHMCDDNREPPVERHRYLPAHQSLLANHRERKL